MTHGTSSDLLDTLRRALAGRYDVDRLLGQGGMGSVYLGRDVVLDRPVAIKVISTELSGSTVVRDRFLQEARLVARLRHPGIVAVYAAGEADGLLYFVMELVDGESLHDRLLREGRTPPAESAVILRDLARALAYAHAQGVVHRDVKPENVILERGSGRALLLDFGVARAFSGTGDARATATGMVLGSPKYMSPEQASGERELDGRSDVYSLGLVGYEMLSGEPAVSATTPGAAIVAQITQRPAPLAGRAPDASPALVAALERAIEKAPEDRWATAGELAEALDAAIAGRALPASAPGAGIPAAPAAPAATAVLATASTRRRVWFGVAGLAVVAAAAVFALLGRGAAAAGDARKSFLVAPFEVTGQDAGQFAWLREGSVSMLSLNLAQWNDLAVVDYERALDLLREAGLDDRARVTLDDARDMARRAKVGTVVMGQVTGTPDSLLVAARLFDVASGERIDEARHAIPRAADPRPAFDALARDLLDLVGAPRELALQQLAQTTTGSVEAYRAYLEGSRALNRWQLARADSLFARATALDTTFALAYYRRALTAGWRDAQSPEQLDYIDNAIASAGRLPAQQREILDAYRDLTQALRSYDGGDTARTNALFLSAQRKYGELVRRDSTMVEAWYGLGDALWHHNPDGWGNRRTVSAWSASMRAFDRVLELDSTFHLVYSHKLELYRRAAGGYSPFVLDGDTLVWMGDTASWRAIAPTRDAARRRAEEARAEAASRAIREARAWSRTDPVPQAYLALVSLYAETRKFDSALVVLEEALARPGVASMRLRLMHAAVVASRSAPEAVREVRTLLAGEPAAALREEGLTGDVPETLVLAGGSAAYGGGLDEVDGVARLMGTLFPKVPGTRLEGRLIGRWFALQARLAVGVPWAQVKPAFDSTMQAIERLTPGADQQRNRVPMASPLILAYLVSRDPRYVQAMPSWGFPAEQMTEIQALEALRRGDTARARELAGRFASPDSVRRLGAPLAPVRWIGRALVLEELGDVRGALATYELLDPTRLTHMGRIDTPLPIYGRSVPARARLYEQLGEREKAAAEWRRFLDAWAQAHPSLEPQKREARAALARLGDAAGRTVPAAR